MELCITVCMNGIYLFGQHKGSEYNHNRNCIYKQLWLLKETPFVDKIPGYMASVNEVVERPLTFDSGNLSQNSFKSDASTLPGHRFFRRAKKCRTTA